MKVRFRLAEILKEFGSLGRGTIKKIADETGLERHQVSALLKNEVQYLSLTSLGALCDYLINTHRINSYELPGRLFSLEPDDFWRFLSEREQLVMSFGVRHELQNTEVLWIPASDSYLQGMLLHELFGNEAPKGEHDTERISPTENETKPSPRSGPGPRFEQYMVRSCSHQPNVPEALRDGEFQQMKREASWAYDKFQALAGNKALVCLGSVKSNGLCELTISGAFGSEPWSSQEDVAQPGDRTCPFYFRYRANDVQVPSCHGGQRLAKNLAGQIVSAESPGLYYEREPNLWEGIPANENREPALIFYTFRPHLGIVEAVLGGFSAVGTFLLARHFRKIVREIWPATYLTPSLEAGVFLVDFELSPRSESQEEANPPIDWGSSIPEAENVTVIRLPVEVLEARLAKNAE